MACCACGEDEKGIPRDSIYICSNCTQEMMGKSPQEISNIVEEMAASGQTVEAEFISKCFFSASPEKKKLTRRIPTPVGLHRRRKPSIK